jgi:hypothetical protein
MVDKATKLETIFDRIAVVRARFAVLERDARIAHAGGRGRRHAARRSEAQHCRRSRPCAKSWPFCENANVGGEFMSDRAARIAEIGASPLRLDRTGRQAHRC